MARPQMAFPKRGVQQTAFGGYCRTVINTILWSYLNQVEPIVSRLRKQSRSYLSLANLGLTASEIPLTVIAEHR